MAAAAAAYLNDTPRGRMDGDEAVPAEKAVVGALRMTGLCTGTGDVAAWLCSNGELIDDGLFEVTEELLARCSSHCATFFNSAFNPSVASLTSR